ncbi:glycosyl hydrolase family 18 protein [Massilia sp. CF038]|uniref:glycosyl hydrolase family 18 protein n=1 Tax=Massilia sp. CF038 TaxID=1881045 RepID=UPI00090ECB0B|nr:glycosyl hydrolase family 18 protein [Massilia sp. CF038]SHH09224.1 Chitinase [Massilia sp. CF038]
MRKIRTYLGMAVMGALLIACGGSQDDPKSANAPIQKARVESSAVAAAAGTSVDLAAGASTAAAAGCNAVIWAPGINYPLGTVVLYQPNGQYYKVVQVAGNGSDGTTPTISTWYWQPFSCVVPSAKKIVAGYYPNWTPSPLRIRDINPRYNLIYLFAATPVGGAPGTTGAVTWSAPGNGRGAASNLNADIQYARSTQGRKIILSVGGAGNGMSFPNRAKSQTFVNSIAAIYRQLGGIDGMDWNTFEGSQAPDTSEMIWISLELKRLFPGFIISAPPAPWNNVDKEFCRAMVAAGALDYAAPQYYDGPGLNQPAYVVDNVRQWVNLLGANRVVVGFGINNVTNYMTREQAITTWKQVKANHPDIRGGFDWQINTDEAQGWPFANGVGPLINP